MKKIIVLLSCLCSYSANAQWTYSGGTARYSGNVGIGSTNYTYAGPAQYGGIEFPRGSIMFSNTNTQNQLYLAQNGYMGASGSYLYRNSSVASALGIDNGGLFFMTAPTGAAGSTIPWSVRFHINNAGNVGIGPMSPGSKLHIAEGPGGEQLQISRGTGAVRFVQDIDKDNLYLYNKDASKMYMFWKETGNVGIGTITPDYKLTVNGKIKCEELQVIVDVPADYVFEENYKLLPLEELEKFIRENKHLPGVPKAEDLKTEGYNVGQMNNKLLEKVEELTLYVIRIKNEVVRLEEENKKLKKLLKPE